MENMVIISAYTREQALEDGLLVDVTKMAQQAGFVFPVAVTSKLWNDYVLPSAASQKYGQSMEGRLWDVLSMLAIEIRRKKRLGEGSSNRVLYRVAFSDVKANEDGGSETIVHQEVSLLAHFGPGDDLEPVITISLPDED